MNFSRDDPLLKGSGRKSLKRFNTLSRLLYEVEASLYRRYPKTLLPSFDVACRRTLRTGTILRTP